jgi:transcriptional regulator with XRE-family HTH domain
MGAKPRPRQRRLGEKLLRIRNALGLSQTGMLKRLGVEGLIPYTQISKYESGTSEPPLIILLQYTYAAGVNMEVIVDDELDLPDKLPGTADHEGIRRKFAGRSKRVSKGRGRRR